MQNVIINIKSVTFVNCYARFCFCLLVAALRTCTKCIQEKERINN